MRFSIRDLAIAMTLLSVYLAVLTKLTRTLQEHEADVALVGALFVLLTVLAETVGGVLMGFIDKRRRLTIFRPQPWTWHYCLAIPAILIGLYGIWASAIGVGYLSLYVVLSVFSVHLFLCLNPLLSLGSDLVIIQGKKFLLSEYRYELHEQQDVVWLKVFRKALNSACIHSLKLPENRVEQVRQTLFSDDDSCYASNEKQATNADKSLM